MGKGREEKEGMERNGGRTGNRVPQLLNPTLTAECKKSFSDPSDYFDRLALWKSSYLGLLST